MRARTATIGLTVAVALLAPRALRADPGAAPDSADERKPARPPLPLEPPRPEPPPRQRHIDIGPDLGVMEMPASHDGTGHPNGIRYQPAVGYGVHGRIDILRYVRMTGYVVTAHHDVTLPSQALDVSGTIHMDGVRTYALGARIGPMLPIRDRARAWLAGGIGWGRVEIGRMTIDDSSSSLFVRERSGSFIEFPLAIGASFDVVRNCLAIELETTGAFITSQGGSAFENFQGECLWGCGTYRNVGPFPVLNGSFVETLGLSLIL